MDKSHLKNIPTNMINAKMKKRDREKSICCKYEIDFNTAIGEGGNAKVFNVIDRKTHQPCALKYLNECSDEKKQRFINEIIITREIDEKKINGIVKIIDYSVENFWYVMPRLQPAISYIKNNKKSIYDIIELFTSLTSTLISIHDENIAHRDIKPDNIYIDGENMILGDFGLAKRLEKNSRNLTLSDKPLGAIFTMAPEMKRSPAGSDGKKADVYSLAKTLWMFLTLNDTGFEGQYNFLDKTHSLRFDDKYQGVHLVEIEELLCDSTNNDPDKRPDMRTFLETLKKWQTVFRNTELSQKSDWRFITKIIFGESSPQRAAFDKLSDIYNILNIISKSPTFNHMFFAGKGGSDLVAVERAKEPGCLYLVLQPHGVLVAKPKILYYCGFLDTRWNYFLLELEDLPIAVGDDITQHMEFVVEDFPGHYTSAKDAIYGVYDYDSGEKLPDGFKIVNRCIHEKLLITMKMGPYNYILSTYDGRHANCSTDVFFTYISTLSSAFSSLRTILRSDEKALAIISKVDNPFNRNTAPTHTTATKRNSLPRPVEFIKNEFPNWDFSNCLSEGGKNQGTMRFYFALRCESCIIDVYEMIDNRSTNELTNSRDRNLFIFSDGKLQSCTNDKAKIFNNNFYYLSERNAATQVRNSLNEKLRKLCVGYQMDDIECPVGFTIIPLRALPPTHLFSRDELKRVMRAADDRKSNRLVIDEFGYIRIISGEEEYMTFPVAHEMYMPRKNYVGKYSSLSHLEDVYCYMLFAWLRHLKEDQHIFCNDYTFPIDIANVLKEIQTYY